GDRHGARHPDRRRPGKLAGVGNRPQRGAVGNLGTRGGWLGGYVQWSNGLAFRDINRARERLIEDWRVVDGERQGLAGSQRRVHGGPGGDDRGLRAGGRRRPLELATAAVDLPHTTRQAVNDALARRTAGGQEGLGKRLVGGHIKGQVRRV